MQVDLFNAVPQGSEYSGNDSSFGDSGGVSGSGDCALSTGNDTRKGRRPVHASNAAKTAAFRAKKARIDYTDTDRIKSTVAELAKTLDVSQNEVMQSLVRFALTNRNWKQVGLYGARADGALL